MREIGTGFIQTGRLKLEIKKMKFDFPAAVFAFIVIVVCIVILTFLFFMFALIGNFFGFENSVEISILIVASVIAISIIYGILSAFDI